MLKLVLPAAILAAGGIAPAHALCIYKGVDNARTTLAQEFRDARWVVRARVVGADYHWSDGGDSWTLYKLRVVERYKGKLSERFTFFTERNSGGFYFDREGGRLDMDGEYLVFLVQNPRPRTSPRIARGALWVNYNCGQSKPWSQVTSAERAQLRRLSGQP